jgi:hypothetical protein
MVGGPEAAPAAEQLYRESVERDCLTPGGVFDDRAD